MFNQPYAWQVNQWHILESCRTHQKLPHAILLHGIPGLGKLDFAQFFAKSVLCNQNLSDGYACGQCQSCHWLTQGTHPDFMWITSEDCGHAIKIDQIRELIYFLTKTSALDGFRVVILCLAEHMNSYAANALLKILEEPGDNTLLLLVSNAPHSLLPTIRSRCMSLSFSPCYDIATVKKWIIHQEGQVSEELELLLKLVEGAPLKILSLQTTRILTERKVLFQGLQDLLNHQLDPCHLAAKTQDFESQDVLFYLISWVKDLIMVNYSSDVSWISNIDYCENIKNLANKVNVMALWNYYDQLLQARKNFSCEFNLNKLLWLESILCQWLSLQ